MRPCCLLPCLQFTGKHTFFGKTASLLQTVDELGNIQKILLQLMVVLVGISLLLCGIAFGYMLSKGETLKHALEFTVVLLVASIPLAIEIVVTATLALGSRQLSAHGAIVTRLTAIEEMAGMNMLCSDKTGTLTLNKMVIQVGQPCTRLTRLRCMAAVLVPVQVLWLSDGGCLLWLVPACVPAWACPLAPACWRPPALPALALRPPAAG